MLVRGASGAGKSLLALELLERWADRRLPALLVGDIRFIHAPEGVLAFTRQDDAERLLCVFNIGREPVEFRLDGDLESLRLLDAPGFPAPAREPKTLVLQGLGVAVGILA